MKVIKAFWYYSSPGSPVKRAKVGDTFPDARSRWNKSLISEHFEDCDVELNSINSNNIAPEPKKNNASWGNLEELKKKRKYKKK